MDNYHLIYEAGEWQLKKEHALSATLTFGSAGKAEAERRSAEYLLFSGTCLKIHDTDGGITGERNFPRSADLRRVRNIDSRLAATTWKRS